MGLDIETTKRFEKDIKSLDKSAQKKIVKASFKLSKDPYGITRVQNITKLQGFKNEYRLRVADYRIRFDIDSNKQVVTLLTVAHRKEIYR